MLDQLYADAKKFTTPDKMRICRRIMLCTVMLTKKALCKPEVRDPINLQKLMDVGTSYLTQWHNYIVNYVTKTNEKFEHLQGLLDELTDSSDDEESNHRNHDSFSMQSSYRDSTHPHTPQQNHAYKSSAKKDMEKRSDMLVRNPQEPGR